LAAYQEGGISTLGIEKNYAQLPGWSEVKDKKNYSELPNKRRLERIALYKAVIRRGHERILELGCGAGDLAYALVDHAQKIVATDIDENDVELARRGRERWALTDKQFSKLEFKQMSALKLDFPDGMFDWVISTSMVEHLDPDDIDIHLREVQVLKAGGSYLIWCPNGAGHHADRDDHLTMLSYRQWMEKLTKAGFRSFRSTLTSRLPVVDARWKVFLERFLLHSRIKIMWSHLGVRNVLIAATR
jgi:ubiquinone/menaquinone biosynthesis C-methylase UbiE